MTQSLATSAFSFLVFQTSICLTIDSKISWKVRHLMIDWALIPGTSNILAGILKKAKWGRDSQAPLKYAIKKKKKNDIFQLTCNTMNPFRLVWCELFYYGKIGCKDVWYSSVVNVTAVVPETGKLDEGDDFASARKGCKLQYLLALITIGIGRENIKACT